MGKRLQKVDGGVINQHGVFISDEKAKQIRYGVNNYNKQVNKLKKEIEKNINFNKINEYQKAIVNERMKTFGVHTMSKSLQNISSDRALIRKLDFIKRNANAENFKDDYTLYRDNFVKALNNAYGEGKLADKVINEVMNMKPVAFMAMTAIDDTFNIEFDYSEYTEERLREISGKLKFYTKKRTKKK